MGRNFDIEEGPSGTNSYQFALTSYPGDITIAQAFDGKLMG